MPESLDDQPSTTGGSWVADLLKSLVVERSGVCRQCGVSMPKLTVDGTCDVCLFLTD